FPVEDSVPSVVTNATRDSTYTFVRTEDALDNDPNIRAGKVWVHVQSNIGPSATLVWTDLDAPATPGKKALLFNPAAIALPAGWPPFTFRVFVVGADKKLYSRDIGTSGSPVAGWQPYDVAGEPACNSSPFVVAAGSTLLVFVTDESGVVHRLTVDPPAGRVWN